MKKKPAKKVNKSELIRNFYIKKPDAKPSEIVAEMKKKGITVSAQQVSTTRMNAIKAGKLPAGDSKVKVQIPGRRGRPVGSGKARPVGRRITAKKNVAGDEVSVTALLETKQLIEKVGMGNVKNALTTLEHLLD
ncbi:MAG: hypothetical protein AAFN77_04560 [Planctomycetota bacterium]